MKSIVQTTNLTEQQINNEQLNVTTQLKTVSDNMNDPTADI